MTTPLALATLQQASKRYGPVQALDRVDLAVHAGEVLALLGPNGAGKTSAISLLCGLRAPSAGQARLFGQDPRTPAARRRLGVMLQATDLPDALTVVELLRQFAGYYPAPRDVEETLDLCGLTALAGRRYGKLSGGQKRRAQFALAICGRPGLVVVDEPTTGLDVEARAMLWRVLRQLVAEGAGLLLTTHYLEEADALADRVVLLGGGRVVAEGSPTAVKARAGCTLVRCHTALSADTLASWSQVQRLRTVGRRLELATVEPEALLRQLLAADAGISDIEVQRSSLDDAMLQLTREAA